MIFEASVEILQGMDIVFWLQLTNLTLCKRTCNRVWSMHWINEYKKVICSCYSRLKRVQPILSKKHYDKICYNDKFVFQTFVFEFNGRTSDLQQHSQPLFFISFSSGCCVCAHPPVAFSQMQTDKKE